MDVDEKRMMDDSGEYEMKEIKYESDEANEESRKEDDALIADIKDKSSK